MIVAAIRERNISFVLPSELANQADEKPVLVFFPSDLSDAFALRRQLGESARLVIQDRTRTGSILQERLRSSNAAFVVADCRGLDTEQVSSVAVAIRGSGSSDRCLLIEDPNNAVSDAGVLQLQRLRLQAGDSASAVAAALRFGDGNHGVLIEVMLELWKNLAPVGCRVVSEVMGTRFLHRTVSGIARELGASRSVLYRQLRAEGDPTPRRLLDWCYTLTAAQLFRQTNVTWHHVQQFLRATDRRTARLAVGRVLADLERGRQFMHVDFMCAALQQGALYRRRAGTVTRAW